MVGITGSSISAIFKRRGLIIAVNHQITTTVATEPATKIGGNAKKCIAATMRISTDSPYNQRRCLLAVMRKAIHQPASRVITTRIDKGAGECTGDEVGLIERVKSSSCGILSPSSESDSPHGSLEWVNVKSLLSRKVAVENEVVAVVLPGTSNL